MLLFLFPFIVLILTSSFVEISSPSRKPIQVFEKPNSLSIVHGDNDIKLLSKSPSVKPKLRRNQNLLFFKFIKYLRHRKLKITYYHNNSNYQLILFFLLLSTIIFLIYREKNLFLSQGCSTIIDRNESNSFRYQFFHSSKGKCNRIN